MGSKARPKGVCVHCKTRAMRGPSLLCGPCITLAKAEGTYEKLAQPNFYEKNAAQRRAKVKEYNALLGKGKSPADVAKLWDWKIKYLANYMLRAKKAGLEVTNYDTIRFHQPQEPRTPLRTSVLSNEHGGGRGGVRGCKCEPCLQRRRATWREVDAERRLQRKQQRRNKPS